MNTGRHNGVMPQIESAVCCEYLLFASVNLLPEIALYGIHRQEGV